MEIESKEVFHILKDDIDFKSIRWVLKARHKDNTRIALLFFSIQKDSFICTDGHRLHMFRKKHKLSQGLYIPIVNTKKQIIMHKDLNKYSYPKHDNLLEETKLIKTIEAYPYYKDTFLATVIRALDEDKSVNHRYIFEMVEIFNDNVKINFYSNLMMRFSDVDEKHIGYLMPMNLNRYER